MPVGKPKATGFKVEGMQLKQFFKDDFVAEIEEKFNGIKFEHFCLSVKPEDEEECVTKLKDRFVISHQTAADEKNAILEVETRNPESCKDLIDMMIEYYEKIC